MYYQWVRKTLIDDQSIFLQTILSRDGNPCQISPNLLLNWAKSE
jgi:hypothetical protein